MFTSIIRCFIIYIVALIVMRVMGKRQIAQMQPFEFVITLIIADLATIPMSDTNIPLLNGIIPLFTLAVIHFIFTLTCCKCNKWRKFVNGNPMIVIDPDGINEENLKKMYLNICDVIEACRNAGFFNLDDINYALLETNGTLSVLPKSDATPLTRGDMNIKQDEVGLGTILITEGKYSLENLELTGIDKEKIEKFIKKHNVDDYKNVTLLMQYDDGIYFKVKNEKVKFLQSESLN